MNIVCVCCGTEFVGRADAKTCSTRCRNQMNYRAKKQPVEDRIDPHTGLKFTPKRSNQKFASAETRVNHGYLMKNKNTGRFWFTNGDDEINCYLDQAPEGWIKGRSQPVRKRISDQKSKHFIN